MSKEVTPNVASKVNKPIRKDRKSSQFTLKEKIENENPNKEYVVNEVVLATVPGYPVWPARILEIIGQTIKVEFFGTGERYKKYLLNNFSKIQVMSHKDSMCLLYYRNPIRCNAVSRFELNQTIPLIERKCYRKTMKELELILEMPSELSIFQ